MTAGTEAVPGSAWEGAIAAALIGAERAPPTPSGGPLADLASGGDAGARLLSRLAANGVHHLAGAGRAAEALDPLPPRAGIGPECPPAAATRLTLLLAAGTGQRTRLEEWCDLAAAAGVRAPAWLLPALAAYRRDFRSVEAIAGPELDWLARACGGAPDMGPPAADWTEGGESERRAAFLAFRRRDPDGARTALEAGFKAEKAAMREAFAGVLQVGLSENDEPFLEACLDDRATGVRDVAQRLLPQLPGSRYAARMAERARAALGLESKSRFLRGATYALDVTLPEESPDLARDGVAPNSWESRGGGTRAGLLRAILARAPLGAFSDHPPRLWIELALRSEWAEPVVEGLLSATQRTLDPDWARAMADLLADAYAEKVPGIRRTNQLLGLWVRAVELLPAAGWEGRVGDLIRARKIELVLAMLAKGPETFSESFSAALLDWLAFVTRGSDALRRDLAKPWVVERLGERLRPSENAAAAAAAILARMPEDTDDTRLRGQLARLAETLELRATMRREFA